MFARSDLIDSLNRDLSRTRDKRDVLASHVTTLTAQIAELEAHLSEENDRRERDRAVGEIEGIKERLRDFYWRSPMPSPGCATRVHRRVPSFQRHPNLVIYSLGLPLTSPT
jgi:hypothetical protein